MSWIELISTLPLITMPLGVAPGPPWIVAAPALRIVVVAPARS
jgi:hypothetical protein